MNDDDVADQRDSIGADFVDQQLDEWLGFVGRQGWLVGRGSSVVEEGGDELSEARRCADVRGEHHLDVRMTCSGFGDDGGDVAFDVVADVHEQRDHHDVRRPGGRGLVDRVADRRLGDLEERREHGGAVCGGRDQVAQGRMIRGGPCVAAAVGHEDGDACWGQLLFGHAVTVRSATVANNDEPIGPDSTDLGRDSTGPERDSNGPERDSNGPDPEIGVGPHTRPWPDDPRLDPELLEHGDRRNVVDRYRYWSVEAIVADLDTRRHGFDVAIENWRHDMNIGTVVRNANAFGAARVHIVGRKRWNRRGAMVTDRYVHVEHHGTAVELAGRARSLGLTIVGIDNLGDEHRLKSSPLDAEPLPQRCVLLFGQEGAGLSDDAVAVCDEVREISMFGSTRSINAGVASGIAMHAWVRAHAT